MLEKPENSFEFNSTFNFFLLLLDNKLSPFQIDIYTFKGHNIIIICYVILDDQLVISIHKLD